MVDGFRVLAGNFRLLKGFNISFDSGLEKVEDTVVAVAVNDRFAGYFMIADRIKDDAGAAICQLRKIGHRETVMLWGDKVTVVQKIAHSLQIDRAFGDLHPEDEVQRGIV